MDEHGSNALFPCWGPHFQGPQTRLLVQTPWTLPTVHPSKPLSGPRFQSWKGNKNQSGFLWFHFLNYPVILRVLGLLILI